MNKLIFLLLAVLGVNNVKAVMVGNEAQKALCAKTVRYYGYDCVKPLFLTSMAYKVGWVLMCKDSLGENLIYTLEDDGDGKLRVSVD